MSLSSGGREGKHGLTTHFKKITKIKEKKEKKEKIL
jgi:hypothetical protein